MNIMSFTYRGLAGPLKKIALRRVVSLERPDVLLLQETLGVREVVRKKLECWFLGWHFEALYVKGRSGGLAVRWDERRVKLLNIWGMDSIMGMTISALDIEEVFLIMNVYGPYLDRVPFWENFLSKEISKGDLVIIGGDLNFSLGRSEVWGPTAHVDILSDYFIQKLGGRNLIDLEPVKLKPTWRNNSAGEHRVAKRLDCFLISEQLVESNLNVRQWIGSGGASDHFPIFLKFQEGRVKPPSPLKFNKIWLKDPSFFELVKILWVPFLPRGDLFASFQFARNINHLKKPIKEWAQAKLVKDDQELKEIEETLANVYEEEGGGHMTMSSKELMSRLEGRRNTLLQEREESWRLKS